MSSAQVISRNARTLLAYRTLISNSTRNQSVWTSDNVVKSPFKDVEIPNTTILEQMWKKLDIWADKTALVGNLKTLRVKCSS